MKPLIRLAFVLALLTGLLAALVWQVMSAGECASEGGIVVAPLTRAQTCER